MIGISRNLQMIGEYVSAPLIGYYNYVMSLSPDVYWRLGDSIGSTVVVDEVSADNGSYVNTPSLEQSSLIPSDLVNKSVYTDGISQYINLNNYLPTLKLGNNKTIAFTFSTPDSLVTKSYITFACAHTVDSSSYDIIQIGFSNGSPFASVVVKDDSNNTQVYLQYGGNIVLIPNTSYNLVLIQDDVLGGKLYLNGIYQIPVINDSTGDGTWFGTNQSRISFLINKLERSNINYYESTIDELILFDTKLTTYEINQLKLEYLG